MARDRPIPRRSGAQGRSRDRTPKPLDPAELEAIALAYVARFATSASKFRRYLAGKLRERGWDGAEQLDLDALVARYVGLGYVDDAAFAKARSGSLLRRGYGPRRIGQALGAAGIAEEIRADVRPEESAQRAAALAMARKRRFGPFGAAPPDPPAREKQIAALLRAGHMLASARAVIDARSPDAAELWAAGSED